MILVTGATGLLGSHICRKLLNEHKPFIALKRGASDLSLLADIEGDIQWHEGDVAAIDSLEPIMDKVTEVIHSAAIVSYVPADFSLMEKVNIEGTRDLVNLCLKHNIKYFLFVSSVAALGRTESQNFVDETNKWKVSKFNTHYGGTKYMAELEVWRAIQEGMTGCIVNPSLILGQGDWDKSSSQTFKYVYNENKYYPAGTVNYVDARDVSDIITRLMEKGVNGERFVVNAGSLSYKSFFGAMAKHFHKKPPYKLANKTAITLVVFLEKIKSLLFGAKPVITEESARISKSSVHFSNEKIKNELNYKFRDLNDTLAWVADYYLGK